jgi:hypothetical protein
MREELEVVVRRANGTTYFVHASPDYDISKVLKEGETVVSSRCVSRPAMRDGFGPTDEEVEEMCRLERLVFGADRPDASPEVLKEKEERVTWYRKHKAEEGEPVDDLSDQECWQAYAQPIRWRLRVMYP